MLNRVGNKEAIAHLIVKEFTPHTTYMELFFGAGGLFFNKPRAKINVLNDKDNQVINFWECVRINPNELLETYNMLPVSDYFFGVKMREELEESKTLTSLEKAAIFLLRSNLSLYGKSGTITITANTLKDSMPTMAQTLSKFLQNCIFVSKDYADALKMIGSRTKEDLFIYADPPYVGTGGGYIESFNDKRLDDLVERLVAVGCNFAISEFDSEHVLQIAENYNLNVIHILQRTSIKSKRNEVLLTNYDRINTLF